MSRGLQLVRAALLSIHLHALLFPPAPVSATAASDPDLVNLQTRTDKARHNFSSMDFRAGHMRGCRAVVQLACHTPLAVCDRGDERRLDVAVEHDTCVEVPLWCDADMSCTAREEFCTAFGVDAEQLHLGSVLSCRTIRPSESVASVRVRVQRRVPDAHESNAASVLDASAPQLFADMHVTSPAHPEPHTVGDIATVICMRYYTGAAEAASLDNKIHFVEALPTLDVAPRARARARRAQAAPAARAARAYRPVRLVRAWPVRPRPQPLVRLPKSVSLRTRAHPTPPRNMIYCPAAGSIIGVIDWEMALTVPPWGVACCPPWFAGRENAQHEARRRFPEVAGLVGGRGSGAGTRGTTWPSP
ncbi:hypothetical protein GGX14DRAFT_566746 [Mycena pura]|uniref:Aminoglycoside phosphotransferase domain-containing protein n=1 Tax=Mycena pura TaxID=153505 RepID=A0AAD6VFS7_9AGAR|nr:hypothetical protein GGX14DRAFT_566746 [Mycena pura]